MSDTRTQLQAYWQHLDELYPEIALDETLEGEAAPPTVISGPSSPALPWWKRPLAVAAASAIIVLVAIGAVAWLLTGNSPVPPADPSPPTTQAPVPTTVPAPTTVAPSATTVPATQAPSADVGWAAVEVATVGSGGFIADVAAGESGLVAVGYECGDDCSGVSGAVWVSPDGLTWERAESDAGVFGVDRLEAVSRGGPGWVAIGLEQAEEGGPGVAIWWSEDGQLWQQAPSIPEFTGISRVPLGVAANDSQVVAVGTGMDELGVFGRVWSSSDGLSWTMAAELRDAELLNIVSFGTEFLVFGNAVNDNGDWVVAVWASVDGTEWTQVLQQNEVFNAQVGAIAAGANGAIAVGGMPDAAWVSPDGVTWTRIQDLTLPIETRAAIADDQGFVIVGRGVWWASVDAVTWIQTDEALFTDATIGAVTRAGPGLVAVGTQPGQIPTVWVWGPPTG